jgi:nicotinamidase-related amidase
MRHPRLLSSEQALLLIVDVQESFRKVLPDVDNLTRNIAIMVEAAKILNLPVFVTEQYPQGLGKTFAEITACLGDHQYFEKTAFSCCQATSFMEKLSECKRKQIIVCGIETHVCVNQTVHELLQNGYSCHLVSEALSSRFPKNKEIGIAKMVASGAIHTSVETALFEMLVESGTEQFKAVQRLVR